MLALFLLLFNLCSAFSDHRPVTFEQVYHGVHGTERIGAEYFLFREKLDVSWVKAALPRVEYQKLLKQVNFSSQMLVVFSAEESASFSGKLEIVDIYQYTGVESFPINVIVKHGVQEEDCRVSKVTWPFVIAVAERPLKFRRVGLQAEGGYDLFTFLDGCSQAI